VARVSAAKGREESKSGRVEVEREREQGPLALVNLFPLSPTPLSLHD